MRIYKQKVRLKIARTLKSGVGYFIGEVFSYVDQFKRDSVFKFNLLFSFRQKKAVNLNSQNGTKKIIFITFLFLERF